jgi:hypothetical protein
VSEAASREVEWISDVMVGDDDEMANLVVNVINGEVLSEDDDSDNPEETPPDDDPENHTPTEIRISTKKIKDSLDIVDDLDDGDSDADNHIKYSGDPRHTFNNHDTSDPLEVDGLIPHTFASGGITMKWKLKVTTLRLPHI